MSKLPQVSGKETIQALRKIGFEVVSQKGSHVKLSRTISSQKQIVIVPNHKIIKSGTLRNGILKPITLSIDEFTRLLKK